MWLFDHEQYQFILPVIVTEILKIACAFFPKYIENIDD